MRLFIQLENGAPKAWPLIGDNVRYLAPPNVSFPASAEAYETVDLSEFGFETFTEVAQPAFDPLTQTLIDETPVKVAGDWQRQWTVAALDATTSAKLLAAAKAEKWEAIKGKRDRIRQEGGALTGGHWFKSDDQAVGEYAALALLGAGAPGDFVLRAAWRTMAEGVTVDMTPNLVKQILSAGFTQVASIDDVAQAHKAAMEASADPSAYDFSGGWPATFPG